MNINTDVKIYCYINLPQSKPNIQIIEPGVSNRY